MTNRYLVDECDRFIAVRDTNDNTVVRQWDKQRIVCKCPSCGGELWQWDGGARERAEAKRFVVELNSRSQTYVSTPSTTDSWYHRKLGG